MSFIDRLLRRETISGNNYTRRKNHKYNKPYNLKKDDYNTNMIVFKDKQVRTGYEALKYLLSSKQWVLKPNPENDDKDVYDFFVHLLNHMSIGINDIVKQLTLGLMFGFSVHELIYDVDKDGMIVLKDVIPVDMITLQDEPFIFNDDTNKLVGVHQEFDGFRVDLPLDKVLVYSYNMIGNNPYGNGLLSDFKDIVEDKLNINQWLMNYLQKHEAPTLYGKTDNYNSKTLMEAFDNVSEGRTGIVVGNGDEVGVLESSHRGEAFFDTLALKDNIIFRRMFIGNLLLGDTSQTGSYAQSQSQLEFGQIIFDGILEDIANCIQTQIINRLCYYNYGTIDVAPVFSFDKFQTSDFSKLLGDIKPYVDNGTIDSENETLHDIIGNYVKSETGLDYVNTDEPLEQDIQPPDNSNLTEGLIDGLTR